MEQRMLHSDALFNDCKLPVTCPFSDTLKPVLNYCRMALRYFCAKLSKTAISVCTYLWELNTQLILGIYQKWSV